MPRGLPGPEPCARARCGGTWGALPRASALAQFRAALGDRGLAVRGLILVDDALGRGLGVARVGRVAELAHRGLQRGLDGLVALPGLLVLLVALDLGLDIRHAEASLRFWFSSVGTGGWPARGSPTHPQRGVTPTRKDIPTRGPGPNQRVPGGRGFLSRPGPPFRDDRDVHEQRWR